MSSEIYRKTAAVRAEALESRVLFAIWTEMLGRPHSGLVATGDVNGDGIPDLAIIHRDLAARNLLAGGVKSKEDVYVWKIKTRLGAGDGTFRQGPSAELPLTNVYDVAAGDLDGDGAADVALTGTPKGDFGDDGSGKASPNDSVIVALYSNGKAGGFTDPTGALRDGVYRQDFGPVQPSKHRIIAPPPGGGGTQGGRDAAIQVYFNPKEITVDKSVPPKVVNFDLPRDHTVNRRNSIDVDHMEEIDGFSETADVDGDGRADAVVWDDASGQAGVISANLKLASVKNNPLYEDKRGPRNNPLSRTIGVGDLDGDGRADLIGSIGDDVYTASLTVDRQTQGTTFGERVKLPVAGGHGPNFNNATVAVGDVDGDGLPELVAATNGGVFVLDQAAASPPGPAPTAKGPIPTFAWTQASGPLKWMAPESLRLGDVNRDGRLDIVLTVDNTDPLNGPPRVYSLISTTDAKGRLTFKLSGDRSDG